MKTLLIYCCLLSSEICLLSSDIILSVCFVFLFAVASPSTNKVVGGHVTFPCSFSWASTNNKYFCKEPCSVEDILVETKGSRNVTQGRYSIEDDGNGVVTVTIKDLKKSDSGTYWCGVERSIKDSYQEVHLTVTDVINPTVNPRPHVSTTLPNLSTTSNNSATVPNLSATSLDIHTTLLTFTNIHGLSSSGEGTTSYSNGTGSAVLSLLMWISTGLVVMVIVLGLILVLFYIKRRGSKRPKPLQPVCNNANTTPSGETVCLYDEIREEDGQTETLPEIISSSSTTNPADTDCTQDINTCYSTVDFPKDHINTICSPADPPDATVYSSVQQCNDSGTSNSQ
ncbi:CMRF35-like molecule 1 isoform X2 [Esox lucius]|uniref:CMRF35-like molecule 1 isoform X2 n=1 Tax=Esox lucius TaxID=8010 RepID=UPI001477201C|nr:CMRF35-like molecule 1 isoform X2 [Esox lucius]